MSLTGLPLLLLAGLGTLAAGAATGLLWTRSRWTRPLTVLLLEALFVVTVGLEVNRHMQFYPSWRALRGDTGTVAVTAHVPSGRLDDRLPARPVPWRPAGVASWHLARVPTLTVPADYRTRPGVVFPVVVDLGGRLPRVADAVTVTLAPTARTTATALRTLPGVLRRDVRVTTTGWDVVGNARLGAALVRLLPPGLAVLDRPLTSLPPALAAPMLLPRS